MKKPKYTVEQLENDPSLRVCPYRRWETVWSDTLQADVRFVRYEGTMVRLATMNGIAELPDLVPELSIRRMTAKDWKFPIEMR